MHEVPSPKMPPTLKLRKKEDMCILHKGTINGEIYTCKCGAKMCKSCAMDRKKSKQNRLCPVCSSIIFLK